MKTKLTGLNVCLIRPPTAIHTNSIARHSVPPVGLAYIAGAVEKTGASLHCIDASGAAINQYSRIPGAESELLYGLKFEEVFARVPEKADVLGVSIMFSKDWLLSRDFVNQLRARFPRALIVVGGEHVTACADYCLESCPAIDVAVLGEGEETFVDLLHSFAEGGDRKSVSGILFRSGENLIKTSPRQRIMKIDEIAEPAWHLFPLEQYIENACSLGVNLGRSAPLLASRGCPYQCTFCSNAAMWTPVWKARDPEKVAAEMKKYMQAYQVTNFDFFDLTAIVRKDWIMEFCRILVREGMKITWQLPSGTRTEAVDSESVEWLYKSGCRLMHYAPESGSPEELARIKKKVNLENMLRSMRAAYRAGIKTKANIIFGMPGQTWRDVRKTFQFMFQMARAGVNDVSCFSFTPYPGSEMFAGLVKEGRLKMDDDLFFQLKVFTNPVKSISYCPAFSGRQITLLNWTGMSFFYASSFLFRPWRFVNLLFGLFTNNTSTKLGMALSLRRKRRIVSKILANKAIHTVQLPPLYRPQPVSYE